MAFMGFLIIIGLLVECGKQFFRALFPKKSPFSPEEIAEIDALIAESKAIVAQSEKQMAEVDAYLKTIEIKY